MAGKLEESLRTGAHAMLSRLAGKWEGTVRTWFEPGVLAGESPIQGTIRLVLGGRFAIHEYASKMDGEPYSGLAIHGYSLGLQLWATAWIDSFHNDTDILFSKGNVQIDAGKCSVLGSYHDPSGGPDWGWRTTIDLPEPGKLMNTHYNITPAGEEAKAVEIIYRRSASSPADQSDVL